MQFHSPTISSKKISLYLVFFFFIALTFFSREIPFFWDECYYIPTAHHIFDSNFSSIIPPVNVDRGSFPFYGFYMALWWKIFGKSLAVSHAAILPLLIGIAWEYYRLAKTFLSEKWIPFALLLLVLEPTFITQSILMGHDLFLVYFFLLSVNALLAGKKIIYVCSLCLLALHNIKGIPAAFSVCLFYFFYTHFVIHKKIKTSDWFIHLLPVALSAAWMGYHHGITGWYLLTPVKDYGDTLHFDLHGLKRIVLEIWQVIDFGRVFLWCFIFCALLFYRKKLLSEYFKTLFLLLFVPLAVSLIFFSMLDINLCHRYNMVSFLIATIFTVYLLAMIQKKMLKYFLASVFCIGLITGNFWMYGGGFSNGWDSSLKVLPYFKLINEMRDYTKTEKINPSDVGTKFPLYHDIKYSDLSSENFHFRDIETAPFDEFPYILLSNVSNQFAVHEKEIVRNEWKLQKEFHSGLVYLKLFKNRKEIQPINAKRN